MFVKASRANALAVLATLTALAALTAGVVSAVTPDAHTADSRATVVVTWTPQALGKDGQAFPADFAQAGDGTVHPGAVVTVPVSYTTAYAAMTDYLTRWQVVNPQPAGWVTLTHTRYERTYTVNGDGTVATQTPERLAETLTLQQVVNPSK